MYKSNKISEIVKRYGTVLVHIIMMFLVAITATSSIVMLMRTVHYLFTHWFEFRSAFTNPNHYVVDYVGSYIYE